MNKNLFLVKIDRIAAWVLFASMFAYFITGFGMTKGIIDSKLATELHNNYLLWVIVSAFVIHTAIAIRLAFIRWKILNPLTTTFLFAFYLSFIGGFIYVDKFYKKPTPAAGTKPTQTPQASTTATAGSQVKTLTLAQLSKYNGQDGAPAYVAVDKVVYDMTTVFANGAHFGHIAGTELTQEFLGRHNMSSITKYPVVGKME